MNPVAVMRSLHRILDVHQIEHQGEGCESDRQQFQKHHQRRGRAAGTVLRFIALLVPTGEDQRPGFALGLGNGDQALSEGPDQGCDLVAVVVCSR